MLISRIVVETEYKNKLEYNILNIYVYSAGNFTANSALMMVI